MGLIKHRKKRASRKPRLTLRVKVIQVQNVDLFKDFKCNPICVVTTNSMYSRRTSKLKNSKTKWNETLKMKLPSAPQSEWLRIVVYDALQTVNTDNETTSTVVPGVHSNDGLSSSSSIQNSAMSSQTKADSQVSSSSMKSNSTQNSYLYVGEVKLSLLDLFKRKDTITSYRFSLDPAWYRIFDRRLQRQLKDKSESPYVVGDIQLAFKLSTNSKSSSTIQVYNQWRNSLAAMLNHRRNIRRNRSPRPIHSRSSSYPGRLSASNSEENFENTSGYFDCKDEEDDDESHLEFSDNEEYVPDEFTSENHLFSDMVSIDSDIASLADDVDDIDDKEIVSIMPVLDEYEVVDPDIISNFSQVSIIPEDEEEEDEEEDDDVHAEDVYEDIYMQNYDDFEDEDEIDEYEDDEDDEADDITLKYSGNRLRRLRRNHRSPKIPSRFVTPTANYKISKKQHAFGVVFVDFKQIRDLPLLKNKVSRRTYDMDPFIIAMFGRRVFKTSWKKQSLNPVFNECAAFEVFPEEIHFGFHFNVLDKDSFSSNDKIAHCSLSWSDMVSRQTPENDWVQYELPLELTVEPRDSKVPSLSLRIKFVPYSILKKFFWQNALAMHTSRNDFNIADLTLYLDKLGSFTVDEVCEFFTHFGRRPWAGDYLNKNQIIEFLQTWRKTSGFRNVWKCPNCSRSCKPTRNTMNSKLVLENDLITHFAVCSYERKSKLLKPSYVSSDFASKRWFSKVLIKLTYGKYALGSNNANILVQDRNSGIVMEEKISAHVKLGMRIIYNGKGKESKKFRALLKNLSVRQGKKFDDPISVRQIAPFIKFHSLNMAEYEDVVYKTFNDFFYRRLKTGSRPPEGDNKIFVSPADSRCTVFSSIHQAKEIWIKGTRFTLGRLTKNYKPEIFNDRSCSVMIFRLAPQDYHRFHCPCDAVIGKPIYVDGEYYTVNPMAVRSSLDVFGENVRVIIPLESPDFGTLLLIPIGAMMVGSIILDREEGDFVKRGEELGYFKFGGSTVVIVIPSKSIILDTDLSKNSVDGIETLVKVGMSVGHSPLVAEHKRERIKVINPAEVERIKRKISVTDENTDLLGSATWEYHALQNILSAEYGESAVSSYNRDEIPRRGPLIRTSSSLSSASTATI